MLVHTYILVQKVAPAPDYDAPLSEAGHYTPKYFKAKEMIAGIKHIHYTCIHTSNSKPMLYAEILTTHDTHFTAQFT
jgi:hypothetical protein